MEDRTVLVKMAVSTIAGLLFARLRRFCDRARFANLLAEHLVRALHHFFCGGSGRRFCPLRGSQFGTQRTGRRQTKGKLTA